jgi:RNA polymerase sigma-70 factor (ECF subfamily)
VSLKAVHTNETALLESLRLGDEAAFDALFRLYYQPLCRYAQRTLEGDPDEAEEIVQAVFVKIWEQRERLDIQWTLKAYLFKMVHNRCLNWIRDHRNRQAPLDVQENATAASGAADQLHGEDLQRAVATALDKLPPQCRKIFELSRFEELKYREIADQLDLSVKTVEVQMGKALRLLRGYLADFLIWAVLLVADFLLHTSIHLLNF